MLTELQKKIQAILEFVSIVNENKFPKKDHERLLSAMLSPNEIEVIHQRILVISLLHTGKSQREISEQLGVGVATATRGNRILKENIDLFQKILKKNES